MRVIYYDTETTGLNAPSDRIVEIAALEPACDKSFVQLINPGMPIPPETTAVHHIDDAMVADAPSFAVVGKAFIDFCDGDEVVLVAHNNDAFDIHFLRHECARHGLELPKHWKFVDSLRWARRYRPDLPRHNLQYLREIYQVEERRAHRALDDIIVLHEVFSRMTDDLPMSKILELLERKEKGGRMPFGKHRGVPLDKLPKDYVAWLAGSGALSKPENESLKATFEALGMLPTASSPSR